jgi:ribosomal protein S18 acetylase RimI-like enzyme
MTLVVEREPTLDVDEAIEVLLLSSLGERRPIDDRSIVQDMLTHGNLIVTARDGGRLVGFARTLTDFTYVGYLSDIAVNADRQHVGIGRALIEETRRHMGPRSMIVLLAAPAAREYYPKLGFQAAPSAWILRAGDTLT